MYIWLIEEWDDELNDWIISPKSGRYENIDDAYSKLINLESLTTVYYPMRVTPVRK